ncbi:MAG: putative sugar nucleotidyl transferase [Planctomycetaceae bacterium]
MAGLRIALFEDESWRQFQPLSLLRPVFELCCGHGSLRERLQRHITNVAWGAIVRSELAAVYREEQPDARVNDFDWLREAPTLLVSGRWLCDPKQLTLLNENAVATADDVPVALVIEPAEVDLFESGTLDAALQTLAATRRPVPAVGKLLSYPWNLIEHNREWLVSDFRRRVTRPTKADLDPQTAVLGSDSDVCIHPSAEIDPFVVIDARRGPIWIDEGVQLQAFTRLEGPCFIGRGSQLFRANVKAGTTIGPVCRIGGEIEECIFHGYANKYHDGFLGHGYVCPWVNLGALTTNSDLKNDYSTVKVVVSGEAVETGSTKVGCFIGDHTKTAIGSFLNTGTSIGAMSLILPAGELLPKHIPPFSRIWHGALQPLDEPALAAAIATARAAMSRRGQELTTAAEQLLRAAFRWTESERSAAVERATRRRI